MPIRQYFSWVGSVLLAALLVADWLLPKPVTTPHFEIPPNERVNLRIRSDHKWPERVVFDTANSRRSFVAEAYREPDLEKPNDFAVRQHGELRRAPAATAAAQAAAATDDKVSAIPAKPRTKSFRMTGKINADR